MKIYLDFIFIINFSFDFLLLIAVATLLKRNIKIKKIIFGSIFGGFSIFTLFLEINNLELFIFKIIISIFMVLITFSFRNFKYTLTNLIYLYIVSMVLGGFLYFLNIQFSYSHNGLIFFHNEFSINIIVLVILSPIIIYTYVKECLNLKTTFSKYYKVDIQLEKETLNLNGFLDTGNKLVDPIFKKPIILINEECLKYKYNYFLVPITTVSENSMLKCIKVKKINIKTVGEKKDVLVGLLPKKIQMEGIDCILQSKLVE
ncbi:MAG: sigma-E processing peptidase SpoIIGA [Bacilli bacterium]